MYCIPAFLVDYIAQVLAGEVKACHAKWKAAWSIIKSKTFAEGLVF